MDQMGSLADLLTLAKTNGSDNGGMGGGGQWMWLILILVLFGGMGGMGLGGNKNAGGNGMNETSQLVLEKLNSMSTADCATAAGLNQQMNNNTQYTTSAIQGVRDAQAACCCETNLNLVRMQNNMDKCCCETNLNLVRFQNEVDKGFCSTANLINAATNALQTQATNNQFSNIQSFNAAQVQATQNTSTILAAIKENEANILGYMTAEKIHTLENENLTLKNEISQAAQTQAILAAIAVVPAPVA